MDGAGIRSRVELGSPLGPGWGSALPPVPPVIGQVFINPGSVALGGTFSYLAQFSGGSGRLSPGDLPVSSGQALVLDPYALPPAPQQDGLALLQDSGVYWLTVSNAGGGTASWRSEVVVPGFSLDTQPLTIAQGGSGQGQIQVNRTGGFQDPVTFALASAPAGWSCSLAPSAGGAVLDITVPPAQPAGIYSLDITGSSGPLTVHRSLQVRVTLASTLFLDPEPSPVIYGQYLTLTATLGPASTPQASSDGGRVSFLDGASPLGSASLAQDLATFSSASLSAGIHSLSAVFAGRGPFPPASSPAVPVLVSQARPLLVLSLSSSEASEGDLVQFSAVLFGSGDRPNGTVQFFDGPNLLGTVTLDNGLAVWPTSTLASGGHAISARYSGDGNYLARTSASQELTIDPVVNQGEATLTLTSSANPASAGQTVVLQIAVNGAGPVPTGTVNLFGDIPLTVIPLAGGFASLTLPAGSYSIFASYSGDGYYLPLPATLSTQVFN